MLLSRGEGDRCCCPGGVGAVVQGGRGVGAVVQGGEVVRWLTIGVAHLPPPPGVEQNE